MLFATVNRYCSIEGTFCRKQVPFNGEWTYFFAYPSAPQWRDFSTYLKEELGQRGVLGERWEDTVKGELIFSKVCDGIYSHDFLLAEVTDPNTNVLVEIGYALAAGRQPVLLIDKTKRSWDRAVLSSLESCFYESRDEILAFVAKWQAQPRVVVSEPDRRLPLLERMGIFEREELPGTAYHLRPKTTPDWVKRVDSKLRAGYFKLTMMDPSDSVYDDFFAQARKVQESQLIIASLLSQATADAERLNANVALLIGFAIGLGKHVLILQQLPAVPVLDLGTVLRPIETESQAERVVEAWLSQHTQDLVTHRREQRAQRAKGQKADRIRGMYLGHPDAIQDNRLLTYFIPTKEYDDALNARRTIFIGRRGIGKSANFQAATDALSENRNTILTRIAPEDFEIERLSGFFEGDFAASNAQYIYQMVWNYILVSEVAKALLKTDRLYVSPNDELRTGLYSFCNEHSQLLELDFAARLLTKLRELSEIPEDITGEEKRASIEASMQSLRDYQLVRRLKEFADKENVTYFILADDLDKHWRPDTEQSINLLLGLIAEADRLQRFFQGRLKVVLFLREDIYDVLAQHDEDLPKRNLLRMTWSSTNLKHLVAERVAVIAGEDNDDDEVTIAAIFDATVKGVPTFDYLISRTLPRPRDLLDFCQRTIDHAQKNGHETVTEQDVLDAEVEFSESLLRSVTLEFRALYPKLDEILVEFAGVPHVMPWRIFEGRVKDALQSNVELISEWYEAENPDPHYLASVLFKIGVIGLTKEGQGPLFANGRSFAETWSLVAPQPQVYVHPAFMRALDISPGIAADKTRMSDRFRREDPRQTMLDLPDT